MCVCLCGHKRKKMCGGETWTVRKREKEVERTLRWKEHISEEVKWAPNPREEVKKLRESYGEDESFTTFVWSHESQ